MAQAGGRDALRNDGDRFYRRGLVLGLTLAEIFLLLLFLLLLALAGTALRWLEEIEHAETLGRANVTHRQDVIELEHIVDDQRTKLVAASLEINTLIESSNEFSRQNVRLQQQTERLELELDALRPLVELGKELQDIQDRFGLTPESIVNLKEELDGIKPLAQAGAQLPILQEQLESMRGDLARLNKIANARGIDPPCWYEEIYLEADVIRERAVALFDVAVFDEYILVRDRPVPEKYAAEKDRLPIASITFMKRLSDKEFVQMMRPIRQLAKEEKKVRPYSCVFFVNVWDQTSARSKERWKKATERTIGDAFYRSTVISERWEGGGE